MRAPLIGLLCLFALGCKKSTPEKSEVAPQTQKPAAAAAQVAQTASEWKPVSKGLTYQLSLAGGVFGFCDDSGSQQINVATGQQTAGTRTCNAKNEVIQSSCDGEVDFVTDPGGSFDTLSLGQRSFRMNGHSRDCDRDGDKVIVSTAGDIEMMDAGSNKVAIINAEVPDKVVIGSGWVAWNSMDDKQPLRLMTVSKAMEHAGTPKE